MRFMRAIVLTLILLALVNICFSTSARSEITQGRSDINPATAAVNWTPLVMYAPSAPRAFKGSDGQFNLVYEIVLVNFGHSPVSLKWFKVLDGDDSKRTVLSLPADKLAQVVSIPGIANPDLKKNPYLTLNIKAGGAAVVWVNVSFDDKKDVPDSLVHNIVYMVNSKKFEQKDYIGCLVKVDQKSPVIIGSPLSGGRWVVVGGYSSEIGHRRTLFPIDNQLQCAQRYAIDWLRIDDQNKTVNGDPKSITSSAAYGHAVYAVADGKVVGVVEKFLDQPVGKPSGDKEFPGGNSIIIEIPGGYFAFYAHLKPGSIKVREGDHVKRGQIIALLGNSGNSTGPHLHFHVTDKPYILGANSVPYEIEEFKLEGQVADLKKFFDCDDHALPQQISAVKGDAQRKRELPKEGAVITFPVLEDQQ